jgi:hypothetical protein
LHYEKIGRICLFCGVMFHTIGNCNLRQQIVTEKLQLGQSAQDVPFQRYGSWIIEPADIPRNFAIQGQGCNPVFSTFQNPNLSRFQALFNSPQSRRGNLEETGTTKQLIQLRDNFNQRSLQIGDGSSAMTGRPQGKEDIVHPITNTQGGNQEQTDTLNMSALHRNLSLNDNATHSPKQKGLEKFTVETMASRDPLKPAEGTQGGVSQQACSHQIPIFPSPKPSPKRPAPSLSPLPSPASKRATTEAPNEVEGGFDLKALQIHAGETLPPQNQVFLSQELPLRVHQGDAVVATGCAEGVIATADL